MPFVESQKHRVWMAANQKCLVLKKDGSVTFAGEGGEDGTLEIEKGSSEVTPTEGPGLHSISWHLELRLGTKKFVLDVKNGTTVIAKEFTGGKLPAGTASFVLNTFIGPYKALELAGSDSIKDLVVTDMQDKILTTKELNGNRNTTYIVIHKACKK